MPKFYLHFFMLFSLIFATSGCAAKPNQQRSSFSVASFNVSMEARNYTSDPEELKLGEQILVKHLRTGEHPQIKNIAEIIQRTAPDIVLLNEFDYINNPKLGVEAFIQNYLNVSQNGAAAIDYPYYFVAPSNTGLPTTYDMNNDGNAERFMNDAQGFGFYYGHYGMVLLSKYPIDKNQARTFQRFLWSDMPGALKPIIPETNTPFYSNDEWLNMRLSSKSHWDIPVQVGDETVHILASHPTPPVFDGDEDRNGQRNHDENRFWLDYISPEQGAYIYDDRGIYGQLDERSHFVIVGDLNASPDRVRIENHPILALTESPLINNKIIPSSASGAKNRPDNPYGLYHTATWGARADYAMPSASLDIQNAYVFWPEQNDTLHRLVQDRASSSDHFMVWIELAFPK